MRLDKHYLKIDFIDCINKQISKVEHEKKI